MQSTKIGAILRDSQKSSPAIDLTEITDYIRTKMHRDQNGLLVRNTKGV